MKRLFYLFILGALLSCGSSKMAQDAETVYGSNMKNLYERNFTSEQFDSICTADNLPKDLGKWHVSYYKNDENTKVISEYLYLVKLGNEEIIYRSETEDGKTYKVTKRITK